MFHIPFFRCIRSHFDGAIAYVTCSCLHRTWIQCTACNECTHLASCLMKRIGCALCTYPLQYNKYIIWKILHRYAHKNIIRIAWSGFFVVYSSYSSKCDSNIRFNDCRLNWHDWRELRNKKRTSVSKCNCLAFAILLSLMFYKYTFVALLMVRDDAHDVCVSLHIFVVQHFVYSETWTGCWRPIFTTSMHAYYVWNCSTMLTMRMCTWTRSQMRSRARTNSETWAWNRNYRKSNIFQWVIILIDSSANCV